MLVIAPAVTQACNDREQVEPMLAQLAACEKAGICRQTRKAPSAAVGAIH
jgi:hypothetical protein|tara:strand:+ start:1995 stop:2144 length:150 start_codon:yes stop_codon:yes gene_type:complete